MIQNDARAIVQDFKAAIQTPSGYEYANKYKFGHLLHYLEYRFLDSKNGTIDEKKLTEVRAIISDWQKQRLSADGGAAGIAGIIARTEALIPSLPEELPPNKNLRQFTVSIRDHFQPST
jgi:hypothetical protein